MKPFFVLGIYFSVSLTLLAGADRPASPRIVERYGRIPMAFEANEGQSDQKVKFLSHGAGYSLFLTETEAVLALHKDSAPESARTGIRASSAPIPSKSAVIRMKLLGTDPHVEMTGQNELPGKSNYFIGNDPKKWHVNVRQFAKVRYANAYPGVDVIYYGHQRELEYDFVLHPGVSPRMIRLAFEGAERPRLNHRDIVLTTATGDLHLRPPRIYQQANGVRHEVSGHYIIRSDGEVGFEVSAYDHRQKLVIDPILAYSTYLGGGSNDSATSIAVDSEGNAYVAGYTSSTDFPLVNATQTIREGADDVFVSKFNADGTGLVYSTYLGGIGDSLGVGIAVDVLRNAYVCGVTTSPDFPVINAIQPNLAGFDDGFITKINADGSALVFSTYLGGSVANWATGIAVDSSGATYVTGFTSSADFPTVKPIQATLGGPLRVPEAYVTKYTPDGTALAYSTYLGGTASDIGIGIAVDSGGRAYVTGITESIDFPTKNAFQPTNAGGDDAFVTKINAAGSAFVYSTYLGGSDFDSGRAIAVDSKARAYVTGQTNSSDFPIFNAIQPGCGGCPDAFVTKINATGSSLMYSTYLGGNANDDGRGIAVDEFENIYVGGNTESSDFPVAIPLQPRNQGSSDMFVTKLNALGNVFLFSTYLGGKGSDTAKGIALDSAESIYIAGDNTGASTGGPFPTSPVSFQPLSKRQPDAVVAKIASSTKLSTSATTLGFGMLVIGQSKTGELTVTNQGSRTVPINRVFVGGIDPDDFAETDGCGSTLPPDTSCTIAVKFTPATKGVKKAGLGISSSDPASPDGVALFGRATVVSLSTNKLSFLSQPVGTTSSGQRINVLNVGSTQLDFAAISITGTNPDNFSQTNTCGANIAANSSCTITVKFKPTAIGKCTATVRISDDGGASPQRVNLTGTGT